MADHITGYSYFGRSRGLQFVNGGGIPTQYPVNSFVELSPKELLLGRDNRMFRVSRVLQQGRWLNFLSIYEHAKEKNASRGGAFVGATLVFYDCIAPADLICAGLIGMLNYLKRFLDTDHRFLVSELSAQEMPPPREYALIRRQLQSLDIPAGKGAGSSRPGFVLLDPEREFEQACAFFHQALQQPELLQYEELYACADPEILVNKKAFTPVAIDWHYHNLIEQNERQLLRQADQLAANQQQLTRQEEQRKTLDHELLEKGRQFEETQSRIAREAQQLEHLKNKLQQAEAYETSLEDRIKTKKQQVKQLTDTLKNLQDDIKKAERAFAKQEKAQAKALQQQETAMRQLLAQTEQLREEIGVLQAEKARIKEEE